MAKRIPTPRRAGSRTVLTGLTTVLFLFVSLLATRSASARETGLLDVTCTPPSSQTVTYTPPLTNTPTLASSQQVGQYGPCVSLSVPDLTSGTRSNTAPPRLRSCLDLLDPAPFTWTIIWNTGQTSTVSGTANSNIAGAVLVVTLTGTVTSGLFAGDTFVQINTGAATDITTCTLGLGSVRSVFTTSTLEITSV